ncbi:hypothetical protein [Thiocapsa marina]|uniref:Uncharacterized protein n=1 Tax=Thiocapsa marina 5811 TaxID=768671 RepID=F9U5U2_9GAMM|nr:hypothetical protein [Thiocapsa marina]EGV20515.1 hypothetical protein ThimaDRAFT_0293 [Thiocapsa marina 5811]
MKSSSILLIATLVGSSAAIADTRPLSVGLDAGLERERSFATQAGHDWYQQQRRIAAELMAEHMLARLHQASDEVAADACIQGDASPSGRFASAELEQIAHALADPRVIELLETSAYYAAVVEGRVPVTN